MYGLSQIIRAEWYAFGPAKQVVPIGRVPKAFNRRARNFVDRGIGTAATRAQYSLEDAAELGLALRLSDLTMPESEVVSFITRYRHRLREYIFAIPPRAAGQFGRFIVVHPKLLRETQGMFQQFPERGAGRADFFEPGFVSTKDQWAALRLEGGRIIVEIGDVVSSLSLALRKIDAEE